MYTSEIQTSPLGTLFHKCALVSNLSLHSVFKTDVCKKSIEVMKMQIAETKCVCETLMPLLGFH